MGHTAFTDETWAVWTLASALQILCLCLCCAVPYLSLSVLCLCLRLRYYLCLCLCCGCGCTMAVSVFALGLWHTNVIIYSPLYLLFWILALRTISDKCLSNSTRNRILLWNPLLALHSNHGIYLLLPFPYKGSFSFLSCSETIPGQSSWLKHKLQRGCGSLCLLYNWIPAPSPVLNVKWSQNYLIHLVLLTTGSIGGFLNMSPPYTFLHR